MATGFFVYVDDWIGGTNMLSLEARGAYITLCALFIAKDGVLPDNDPAIARGIGANLRRWTQVIKPALIAGAFIEIRDGFLHQEKCRQSLAKLEIASSSQRAKAHRRWELARAGKPLINKNTADAPAVPQQSPGNAPADAPAMPSSSSSPTSMSKEDLSPPTSYAHAREGGGGNGKYPSEEQKTQDDDVEYFEILKRSEPHARRNRLADE